MVKVTKLNGSTFFLNPFLIETMEETPDTIITLTNGKKFIVKESAADVIVLVKEFFRDVYVLKGIRAHDSGGSHV